MVAISPTVYHLYGDVVRSWLGVLEHQRTQICVVPTGESMKTLATVEWLIGRVHAARLPRDGVLVGIGGGILLDIVGLAASLYRRGISHMKIGTTLVAQVDAAVGLKCGANSDDAKNLVGAFYPPELVLTDGAFLHTLHERDIRCGIAEMAKLGAICDANLFEALSTDVDRLVTPETRNGTTAQALVDGAIAGMITQLNANPYEGRLQRAVDYGHTVSGAFEVATGHALAHGEAVALDLALFAAVAVRLGTLDQDGLNAITGLLRSAGLDVWHPIMADRNLLQKGLADSIAHRGRRLNMPLPAGIGSCTFVDDDHVLSPALLAQAAEVCREHQMRHDAASAPGQWTA